MIPSCLLETIYISFPIGANLKGELEYCEPIKINAQKNGVTSVVSRETFGIVPQYDRLISVPYGNKSKYINEQTLLWVDTTPNENYSNMDYKIERKGDIVNGEFILFCNSTTENTKSIYYENRNGKIYQVKLNLQNMVAIVPSDKWLPITRETKIWLTQPKDNTTTTNLVKVDKIEKLSNCTKFTFKRVI